VTGVLAAMVELTEQLYWRTAVAAVFAAVGSSYKRRVQFNVSMFLLSRTCLFV